MSPTLLALERFATELLAFGTRTVADASARDQARLCLADALACAAVGVDTSGYRRSRPAIAHVLGGSAVPATAWFQEGRPSLLGAAYLNSAAISAQDLDDGHRLASGHPGGAVMPAVLAEAEALGADVDLLSAIIVGYEAGVRLAAARELTRVPTLATGRWASFAAAAASCWVAGDDAETAAHALAHAGSMAPHLIPPDSRRTDGLKEATPWAVVAGLTAAQLARNGVPGPTYLLERHPDYDPAGLAQLTAGPRPAIFDTYFKQYGCCRWIHPVIDSIVAMNAAEPIDPGSVTSVEIATFSRGLSLSNKTVPKNLEEAHYSFPFCVALALVDGPDALMPISETSLTRRDVLALARRIHLEVDPRLDLLFPARTPAGVRIISGSSAREHAVDTARGDPIIPLEASDLREKHERLFASYSKNTANTISRLIYDSCDIDLEALLIAIRTTPTREARL